MGETTATGQGGPWKTLGSEKGEVSGVVCGTKSRLTTSSGSIAGRLEGGRDTHALAGSGRPWQALAREWAAGWGKTSVDFTTRTHTHTHTRT